MSKKQSKSFNWGVLKRVLLLLGGQKLPFSLAGILIILLAASAAYRPHLIGSAIDEEMTKGDSHGLLMIFLIVAVLLVVEAIMQFYQTYIANSVAQSVTMDLRSSLFDHVLNFRLRYFDKTPVGTFVTRVVSDIDGIAQVFSNGLLTIVGDILKLIVVIGIMLFISPKLTLIVLIPIPILIFSTRIFQRVLQQAYTQVRNQVSKMNVFIQEHVTGMSIIQVFNQEEREKDKFENINRQHRTAHIRTVWAFSIFFPVVELLSAASIALLIWWGIGDIVNANFSAGDLMKFTLYIFMLYRPIRQLADRFTVLQEGVVNATRVFKLFDSVEEMPHDGKVDDAAFEGEIEFKDVWFSYTDEHSEENKLDWVLKGVSFKVEPGQTIAFVGATGAGKTSIINLLNRFYEYQKGEINIDSRSLKDIDLQYIRKNVAVVLQDVFLFSDSVLNNVTLLDPNISKEQVIAAAKEVGAHEFISKLPGQYDYDVKERGGMLSVGQRQLLAFLRAYVYNPKILVLDEATSSVDTESEELIQHAIEKLTKGRTSIVIAHRLSTIQKADKIIVMDSGRIIESGTHDELIQREGQYRKLFELQFQH